MNDRSPVIGLHRASTFRSVRQRTESLIQGLSAEDCALQSMPDASPLKWHLAHTTWFWETFVLCELPGYRVFDSAFRYLFNSYYNQVGEQFPRPSRGLLSRPDLITVLRYRRHVDQAVQNLLEALDEGSATMPAGFDAVVALGINHEQQHQELMLTDVLHLLDANPLCPAYSINGPRPAATASRTDWLAIDAGLVDVGNAGTGFGFDNESPMHKVWLVPYEIARSLVSNREFRDFIDADGYRRPEFWLSEGFNQVLQAGWRAPSYWRPRADGWHEFSLAGEAPLDEDAPVAHLSYYEADAYARFAGARLPTEFEWEFAVCQTADPPGSVHDEAALGDAFGSVWQWTSSSYAAYPGFAPATTAIGEYNGKFMVNQYVLRGSSCATPCGHSRASYRNFFPASARWQFTGIRLARSLNS